VYSWKDLCNRYISSKLYHFFVFSFFFFIIFLFLLLCSTLY